MKASIAIVECFLFSMSLAGLSSKKSPTILAGVEAIKNFIKKPTTPIQSVLNELDRSLFCHCAYCSLCVRDSNRTCVIKVQEGLTYPLLAPTVMEVLLEAFLNYIPFGKIKALVYEDESYYLGLSMAKLRPESTVYCYNRVKPPNLTSKLVNHTPLADYLKRKFPSIAPVKAESIMLTHYDWNAAPFDIIICPYALFDKDEIMERFMDLLDELGSLLIIKDYRFHHYKRIGNGFKDAGPLDDRQMDGAIDLVTKTWIHNLDYQYPVG